MSTIIGKAREYREIQTFIKQLQDEADALKAAITKGELPDIAARYTKTVEARRFQIA